MKKIFKGFLVIAALVLTLTLTGCNNESGKGIEGSWYYYNGASLSDDIYYQFNADKTGQYVYAGTPMKFTYEDDGTKVTIKYDTDTLSSEYEYKIDGKTLTIKDSFGSDVIYKKK